MSFIKNCDRIKLLFKNKIILEFRKGFSMKRGTRIQVILKPLKGW